MNLAYAFTQLFHKIKGYKQHQFWESGWPLQLLFTFVSEPFCIRGHMIVVCPPCVCTGKQEDAREQLQVPSSVGRGVACAGHSERAEVRE